MPKSENDRLPWPKCQTDEIDPEDPLSADWGYLSFEPSSYNPIFDDTTRPSDDEILSSPICQALTSFLEDGDKK